MDAGAAREFQAARLMGQRLRRLRDAQGLTMRRLGEIAGFTQQQISQVELGKINTPIETLGRIAGALGVPLDRRGALRIIAAITQGEVSRKILRHLQCAAAPPPIAPARVRQEAFA